MYRLLTILLLFFNGIAAASPALEGMQEKMQSGAVQSSPVTDVGEEYIVSSRQNNPGISKAQVFAFGAMPPSSEGKNTYSLISPGDIPYAPRPAYYLFLFRYTPF